MKQAFSAILVLALMATACQNNGTSGKTGLVDSAYTVVLYGYMVPVSDFRTAIARRWIYDTIAPDPADKTRNKMVRDTSYSIFVVEHAVDSLGRKLMTPTGRDSILYTWAGGRSKRIVVKDYGFDYRTLAEAQGQPMPVKK